MKIKLLFPEAGVETIKAMGLRQSNPESLRWTDDHAQSSYGHGVLLREHSRELLDGDAFGQLRERFGAWIECDSAATQQLVIAALAIPGLTDAVKIAR